jgi:hypothetical protein
LHWSERSHGRVGRVVSGKVHWRHVEVCWVKVGWWVWSGLSGGLVCVGVVGCVRVVRVYL